MKTKRCCTCRETKPLEDFYVANRAKDGKQGACKVCMRKNSAQQIASAKARKAERRRLTEGWLKARQEAMEAWVKSEREREDAE